MIIKIVLLWILIIKNQENFFVATNPLNIQLNRFLELYKFLDSREFKLEVYKFDFNNFQDRGKVLLKYIYNNFNRLGNEITFNNNLKDKILKATIDIKSMLELFGVYEDYLDAQNTLRSLIDSQTLLKSYDDVNNYYNTIFFDMNKTLTEYLNKVILYIDQTNSLFTFFDTRLITLSPAVTLDQIIQQLSVNTTYNVNFNNIINIHREVRIFMFISVRDFKIILQKTIKKLRKNSGNLNIILTLLLFFIIN